MYIYIYVHVSKTSKIDGIGCRKWYRVYPLAFQILPSTTSKGLLLLLWTNSFSFPCMKMAINSAILVGTDCGSVMCANFRTTSLVVRLRFPLRIRVTTLWWFEDLTQVHWWNNKAAATPTLQLRTCGWDAAKIFWAIWPSFPDLVFNTAAAGETYLLAFELRTHLNSELRILRCKFL